MGLTKLIRGGEGMGLTDIKRFLQEENLYLTGGKKMYLKMKKLISVVIFKLAAAGLSLSLVLGSVIGYSVASAAASPEPVYFMFASPLSGDYAWLGQRELCATRIAIEDINRMGGIRSLGGAPIKLWRVVDLTSDPKMGAAALEAALTEAKSKGVTISAITTMTVSGMTGPCIPIVEKYGVPLLASVGKTSLTDMGAKYFFRIFPTNEYWAKAQVDFIKVVKEKYMPKFTKLGMAYEETAWPTDLAAQAKKWIKKYNIPINIVTELAYPKGLLDGTPVITKLMASGAEVVILNGYAESLYILKAADAMGYKPLWVGGGGFFVQPELLEERGPEGVKGVCCAMSCNHRWNNPIAKEVNDKFVKKCHLPFITEHGVSGYSGAWIAKYGVEQAGSRDPAKVKDALHKLEIVMGPAEDEGKMKDGAIISPRALFVTPGGAHLKFNEKGDNIYMSGCLVQWQEVEDGKWEPVTVSPEEHTPYRLKSWK